MKITEYISEKEILLDMKATGKSESLLELLDMLEASGSVENKEKVLEILLEREKLGSTGIGHGIAVPHAKSDQVSRLVCCLGISQKGINFDSLDGENVYIVFLVLAPVGATGLHLKALAKIARLLKDRVFKNSLRASKTSAEVFQIIQEDEERLNSLG
jgi:PTS system nitrogen regulatory IIA component